MAQRNTIQCSVVLEAVQRLQNHATADEIYEEVIKTYPSMGKGTVYRNLQKLSESGEIKKIEVPEGADRYDHICKKHYHIKCIKCGKLYDAGFPYLQSLEEKTKNLHGFADVVHDITFKGICPACQGKDKV